MIEKEMSDLTAKEKPWIVCTYFTLKSGYEKEVDRLIASCERFGLAYYAAGIKSLGSWLRNTRYRPLFMAHCMAKFPGKDIVWIDADGIVRQYPALFDKLSAEKQFDIAVHYRNNRELLGGTVWMANNEMVRNKLIPIWTNMMASDPKLREQVAMQWILKTHKSVRAFILPATYCQIFDLMRKAGRPVIEHFQASRRFRKLMG